MSSKSEYFARRILAEMIDILLIAVWTYPMWGFVFGEVKIAAMAESYFGYHGGTMGGNLFSEIYDFRHALQLYFLVASGVIGLLFLWLGWKMSEKSWAPSIAGLTVLLFVIPAAECDVFHGNCDYHDWTGVLTVASLTIGVLEQFFREWKQGQTLGKQMMNMKVVSSKDSRLASFTNVILIRKILNGILIVFIPYLLVDLLFAFFNDKKQCIHDALSRTMVIYSHN